LTSFGTYFSKDNFPFLLLFKMKRFFKTIVLNFQSQTQFKKSILKNPKTILKLKNENEKTLKKIFFFFK